MDDVNEKAASGYQPLDLGSTTGAVAQAVGSWPEGYRSGEWEVITPPSIGGSNPFISTGE
nr:hypothetical protein [Halomarina sp. BND7]